ncbi:DUF2683 family protein [Candidatus Pacearchaeota archaeon]|nr:DUF2683 family protein [Candidatus Pacearchaeota archaeon]
MEKQISARVELNDYANRVLGIIKIKYGLKDKSEALNKFIELYGEAFMEKEVKEDYVKEVIATVKDHYKKYSDEKMSLEELDKLCEA